VSDIGVIDKFTDTFARYVDSGFGLVRGDVASLSGTLIAIDVTLAALFWAMGGADDVIARLIKKLLYVGAFAFIITNFNALAKIIFESFAGLGLRAGGGGLSQSEFLRPGALAAAGVQAAQPIMDEIGKLTGFPDIFSNADTVAVLFLAWLIVIISFFILAIQVFVAIIEFKLTTLAGFVLIPFALWNKTSFLAEKVLGNVVSSGVKILVLAVIVGIGTGLFADLQTPVGGEPNIDDALALILGSLALLAIGIFGPGIANGLISGGPQLGAGAAVGATAAATGLAVVGGAGALAAGSAAAGGLRAATSLTGGARAAYSAGSAGQSGIAGVGAGLAGVARAGATASADRLRRAMGGQQGSSAASAAGTASASDAAPPAWASKLRRSQNVKHGTSAVTHSLRSGDRGSGSSGPSLKDGES
jgi:type IV secretion system protein TrbL